MFSEWRSPRFGESNPTCFDNVVWEWLIRSRISAYEATEEIKGPSPSDSGPTWCFERFGQSKTITPDGRTLYVGGEHKDHYDPDFYIYHDVVVMNPDDKIQIYGYPHNIFPQTDFHNVYRIEIQGKIVRYVEDMYHILVTVEGCLPTEIIEDLKLDLVNKLSELENDKYLINDIKNA